MKYQLKDAALKCSIGALFAVMSGSVAASGFALIEQSVSSMGNAYAGGSAIAEDATTVYFNPAGMSRLSGTQYAISVQGIQPSTKFSNAGTTPAPLQTQGSNGGDAGGMTPVPNVAFVTEINKQIKLGLEINTPFGLQTKYDPSWMGRFQAIKSSLQTINVNPAVSYQINVSVSVGAGVSYQHITGELSSAVNYSAAAFSAGGAPLLGAVGGANKEGISTVKGNGDSYGYNFGALFNFGTETRVGLAYRSQVKQSLSGTVEMTNVPVAFASSSKFANGNTKLDVTLPASFSTSVVHQLNPKFDVMADVTWTGWSVFQSLNVIRSDGSTLSTTPENWKDTWRVSVGTTYRYNENWTSRFGVALDQSPVSDAYRTARIPDQDRTWLAFGGQYKPTKSSALDFGYAHLFVSSASINNNQSASGAATLVGTYASSIDIISLQFGQTF
jgi:long-chain fatty acid transport protein